MKSRLSSLLFFPILFSLFSNTPLHAKELQGSSVFPGMYQYDVVSNPAEDDFACWDVVNSGCEITVEDDHVVVACDETGSVELRPTCNDFTDSHQVQTGQLIGLEIEAQLLDAQSEILFHYENNPGQFADGSFQSAGTYTFQSNAAIPPKAQGNFFRDPLSNQLGLRFDTDYYGRTIDVNLFSFPEDNEDRSLYAQFRSNYRMRAQQDKEDDSIKIRGGTVLIYSLTQGYQVPPDKR